MVQYPSRCMAELRLSLVLFFVLINASEGFQVTLTTNTNAKGGSDAAIASPPSNRTPVALLEANASVGAQVSQEARTQDTDASDIPRQPTSVTVGLETESTSLPLRARRTHGVRTGRGGGARLFWRDHHGNHGSHPPVAGVQFIDSFFGANDVFSDMGPFSTSVSMQVEDLPDYSGLGDEEYHYRKVWNVIKGVRRHKHKKAAAPEHKRASVHAFFESAVVYEWLLLGAALSVFFPLFYYLQDWPHNRRVHVAALFIWIGLGALYNVAVWMRLGRSAGIMWFTGYLLEFIFSIENVFVFHIVVRAFRTPQRLTQKALFIVICCQIVFEMIFFMGFAQQVRAMQVLPYLLGVWLLYVGYHAAQDDGHDDFNIKDSSIFRLSHWVLGNRLLNSYDPSGAVFMFKDRRLCVSLMFPLTCCLLAVDFFLEVDVTLTKIEELPNEYIAFTSSAAAAFAVPELFFVARDLFQRYNLLKYGISFVLVFFGIQMLIHRFFNLPDLLGCAIIIIVMVVCVLASGPAGNDKELSLKESRFEQNVLDEANYDPWGKTSKEWSKEPMPEPPCKEHTGNKIIS